MTTTRTKKINNVTYFKKLTIELYVLYVLNTYVKFVSIIYYLIFD